MGRSVHGRRHSGSGKGVHYSGTGQRLENLLLNTQLPQAHPRSSARLFEDMGKARSPYALINFLQRQRNGDLAANGVFYGIRFFVYIAHKGSAAQFIPL